MKVYYLPADIQERSAFLDHFRCSAGYELGKSVAWFSGKDIATAGDVYRGRCYRDVRYPRWSTVIELDGREAHPDDQRFREMRRDNEAVVQGSGVLRYGWRDIAARPCAAAGQVSAVLQAHGWSGRPRRCGPACPLP